MSKSLLRVQINQGKCQGHGRCQALAPALFALDEHGQAREIGDGLVPEQHGAAVELARANCPEFAIEFVRAAGGER